MKFGQIYHWGPELLHYGFVITPGPAKRSMDKLVLEWNFPLPSGRRYKDTSKFARCLMQPVTIEGHCIQGKYMTPPRHNLYECSPQTEERIRQGMNAWFEDWRNDHDPSRRKKNKG